MCYHEDCECAEMRAESKALHAEEHHADGSECECELNLD